jgi:hypothetical protein
MYQVKYFRHCAPQYVVVLGWGTLQGFADSLYCVCHALFEGVNSAGLARFSCCNAAYSLRGEA